MLPSEGEIGQLFLSDLAEHIKVVEITVRKCISYLELFGDDPKMVNY